MDENVSSTPTSAVEPSVVHSTNPATPPMPEASGTTPPVQPPVVKKSNKKIFIIAGVIILLLMLVMGAALAFTQMQPTQVAAPTPVASSTPIPMVENSTMEWVTYIDDKYSYQVNYPKNYKQGVVLENERGRIIGFQKPITSKDLSLAKVEIASSEKSLSEQYEDLNTNNNFSSGTVGTYDGYIADLSKDSLKTKIYLVGNESRNHLITMTVLVGDWNEFESVFDQFLSTFKFTE